MVLTLVEKNLVRFADDTVITIQEKMTDCINIPSVLKDLYIKGAVVDFCINLDKMESVY